ncbi:hypothetical protein AURDEDRAFT_59280 [Auricularia subglabra TFB-10046 SS5]|nr:hypothetical protein AURDEDRAFT_59280 [Auricularia subglabra TFB-10046 SS5]
MERRIIFCIYPRVEIVSLTGKPSRVFSASPDNEIWLPLIVARYNLDSHPRRTEHWALAVLRSRLNAEIFEVAGTSDTFNYAARRDDTILRHPQLRGGCLVGRVRSDKLDWMREVLRTGVAVVRYSNAWDCQDWVMDGRDAAEDGLGILISCERAIREERVSEWERWDAAQDTIEERLFPA